VIFGDRVAPDRKHAPLKYVVRERGVRLDAAAEIEQRAGIKLEAARLRIHSPPLATPMFWHKAWTEHLS